MFYRKFRFDQDSDTADVTHVASGDFYQGGKGFGFVVEKNRREEAFLQIPELNSAFDTVYWYQNTDLSYIEEDSTGCFLDSNRELERLEEQTGEKIEGEHRRIPLSFKMDVPRQGNYRVTIVIRAEEPMRDVLIFTGRRRLGYRGDVEGVFQCSCMVNVCDFIPRGHTRCYEDKTLDITVVADRPKLSEIIVEEVSCPTVYIAGDSTVTDQKADYPYAPGTSYSGWGQMISGYWKDSLAVSNHSHSGLTTASFRKGGHYAILEKYARAGDFCFFQFGHNDQKQESLKAGGGYRDNLLRYVGECREKGIFPLVVTPIARNTWKGNDGTYNDLLAEYADTCLKIGEQENVPVIDLHGRSMEFIVKNGLEASRSYFFPGDYTHSNDYGAYYMAGLVAQEIVRVCGKREEPEYRFLAECITDGFGPWEPAVKIVPMTKPVIFESVADPEQGAELLAGVDRLSEPADRVSVLDMLIKTAKFIPVNVYNDMFTDVEGHEWYAGTVECAYQNGMIDEGLVEEQKFFPLRNVTLEEFLVFAVNGYKSRRAIPVEAWENACAYEERCRDFARPYVRAACYLGLIKADGSDEPSRVITRGEAVELCRRMKL